MIHSDRHDEGEATTARGRASARGSVRRECPKTTVACVSGLAAVFLAVAPVAAQRETPPTTQFVLDGEIALFENLGNHARAITTLSPGAQAYFDQGLRLAYAFGRHDAQQSFVAAMRNDPQCASCRWGLAWALGPDPYIDGTMDFGAEEIAYEQTREAQRLARESSTEVERALIDALAARYLPAAAPERRPQLDTAYMAAMSEVHRRFPDDADVATMYAASMMVLRPGNYWTRAGNPQPGVDEILRVLEGVLSRDLAHPGACHLYIHATEASPLPERATPCADLLGAAMPGASHLVHMPSHVYVQTGRWGDAVRANELARLADLEAQTGEAVAIYPDHNLHMLLVAAAYDGQSAVAIQTAHDLRRLAPGAAHLLPLVLVRFGRWDEILELPASAAGFAGATLAYARGMAQVRTNRVADARASLAAVEAEVGLTRDFRLRQMLHLARAVLAAEISVASQDYAAAARTLEQARVVETDSVGYSEPEDWIVPLRQVLGAVLLEAGRAEEAETAYRGELDTHPENGWSLYGLHLALAAQGRADEAAATLDRFTRAWARADVRIRASRF